jgi:hypothetical protein
MNNKATYAGFGIGMAAAVALCANPAEALTFNNISVAFTTCASNGNTSCPANGDMHGTFNGDTLLGTASFLVTSGGFQAPDAPPGNVLPGTLYTYTNFIDNIGANEDFFYSEPTPNEFNWFGITPTANPNVYNARICFFGSNPGTNANQCGNSASGINSIRYDGDGEGNLVIDDVPSPLSLLAIAPIGLIAKLRNRYNKQPVFSLEY